VVRPAVVTEAVEGDPDDPAIWVNRADPARSLIVATVKEPAPRGALAVFDLSGRIVQTIAGLDRPNNVDVEYGFPLGGASIDIAVLTERYAGRLRAYRLDPAAGRLEEIPAPGGLAVFEGESGERAAPMGIGLYRRPTDGAIFAIVSRKQGPPSGYLWQYRLLEHELGGIRAGKVREFGDFSGRAEIEAVAVDDEAGYVYFADERYAIRQWHADPAHPAAAREAGRFGQGKYRGDQEGIALYVQPGGRGYVISSDQLPGNSRYLLFPRSPRPDGPGAFPAEWYGGADSTDGLDAASAPLGRVFPRGLVVAMNSRGRNFFLYRWEDVAAAAVPPLPPR
jgi:3-phytase